MMRLFHLYNLTRKTRNRNGRDKNGGRLIEFVKKDFITKCRSSHPEVFRKKGVPASLLKKRLWNKCFPVNFPKFFRTPFFTEYLRWLLL